MSSRTPDGPPRLAEALLTLALPGDGLSETVLGDLHELFLKRVRDPEVGPAAAKRWYWAQAVRLTASYTAGRFSGRGGKGLTARSPVRARGEGVRGVIQQVRYSVRSLLRSPGFTIPSLLILAIGMTAITSIFTVVDSVVFRQLDYDDASRLVLLCEDHARMNGVCVASPGNVADIASSATSFSALGIGRGWQFRLEDERGGQGVRGGLASGGFFRALGVRPHVGRIFDEDEVGPNGDKVVVLSYGLWVSRFGGRRSVLGSTVELDGEACVVVGVLPATFEAPLDMEGILVWKPPHFALTDPEFRGWRGWRAVGRLAPDVSRQVAADEVQALYAGLAGVHDEIDDEWRLQVRPLLDVVVGDSRAVFLTFLAAAVLLLLVVCANVGNLLLTRGLGRRRELAIRAALGAPRRRLVGEILVESFVLTTFATLLAVILARGTTQGLLSMAPPEIPRLDEIAVDGRILAFTGLASIMTTMVFAIVPAMRVTAWDLARVIKSGAGTLSAPASNRLRSGLVVAELALSVVLLASAALLARSFAGHMQWEPGFDREQVATLGTFLSPDKYPTSAALVAGYRAVEERLSSVPGVARVASASAGPLFGGGDGATPFRAQGADDGRVASSAKWFDVGPGFFATLGVAVLQGREFNESDDAASRPVVVINETLARAAWPDADPVGKVLILSERDQALEVVGVVADVPPLTPGSAPMPEMYWPNRQQTRGFTHFVIRAEGDVGAVVSAASDAILTVDPDLSLGTPRTLAAGEERALVRPRFQALVLLVFAFAALALSAVGVYAAVSYAVQRRIREMGIRIALGATSRDVLSLIMRSSLRVALVGVAIGAMAALATGPMLDGLVHGVRVTDPLSVGGAGLLLFVVAALASVVPTRRATRANPLDTIKAD